MASFNPFGGMNFAVVGNALKGLGAFFMYGVPALLIIFTTFYFLIQKKKWNLDVEFKLPRSDGRLIDAEWGKGNFDTKRGVVWLKRKKKKKIKMEPFDITKYIQGVKTLTVVQVGATEYRPVLNRSWMEMENDEPLKDEGGKLVKDKDGKPIYEKAALLKIRIDTERDKAWGDSFERSAKSTYSIMNLLQQYAVPISMGLIIVLWGIQFMMLYNRIK